MEIVNSCAYPHLAAFQIRKCLEADKLRIDREIKEEFGKIHELEEEAIWDLEQITKEGKYEIQI